MDERKTDVNLGNKSAEIEDLEVDNSKSVLHKIASLYAEQLMSDLILEVGGTEYIAHRLILCATSEVFQVMLMNREWSEWRESRIVLQETPAAASVFSYFLKYFYTGHIRISYQTVLPVLSLADKYNVKDLVTLCLQFMSQNIAQAAKRDCLFSWLQYTSACGHYAVAKACQNFVKWNMEWVWSCSQEGGSGLAALEGEALVNLLQHSDLVVHNELALYSLVVTWLDKQREKVNSIELNEEEKKSHWASMVPAVFSHIRFPMMCPGQLTKLLLCPHTQEHIDFCLDRMVIAMNYQSGQHDRVKEYQQTDSGRLLFTPRLYTEDIWGSILSVDNFFSLPSYHTSTFMFSTRPSIAEEPQHEKLVEWTVDLYPKGVWFRKSMLIVWAGSIDVPEVVLRTVRMSITCQNCPEPVQDDYSEVENVEPDVRVKIGVLVWGVQNGIEHVTTVVERVHRFSSRDKVLNIDGVLDFDELNTPLYTPPGVVAHSDRYCDKCVKVYEGFESKHLVGPIRDQLKIQVVIVPLTEYCHVVPETISFS